MSETERINPLVITLPLQRLISEEIVVADKQVELASQAKERANHHFMQCLSSKETQHNLMEKNIKLNSANRRKYSLLFKMLLITLADLPDNELLEYVRANIKQ